MQYLKRCQRVAPLGHRDKSASQVRQVGPGGGHLTLTWIGEPALGQLLGQGQVKPAATAGTKKVASPDHHRTHTRGAKLLLQRHPDAAFNRVGLLRRVLAQQGRHVLSKVVHIAGQHQGGAKFAAQANGRIEHRRALGLPGFVGIGRGVEGMHHHAGTSSSSQ